jgi:hypothetical protein
MTAALLTALMKFLRVMLLIVLCPPYC